MTTMTDLMARLEMQADTLARFLSPIHSGRFTDEERAAFAVESARRAAHYANVILDVVERVQAA